jgi:hypothetical protein
MKNIHTFGHGFCSTFASAGLFLLALLSSGCGPGKPAVDAFIASVTNTVPADGQFIAKLFAEQAGQHGLVVEKPLPATAVAMYSPGPTGLNLSLTAVTMDNTLSIQVIPVLQGRKNNAACRAVIATVDKTLKQAFGARLLTAP